ncbi:hypothetical protein KIV40_33200, partial [Vibrio sp. D173a]|uniref:hypothetical protein n=1 Tax=Vibrio sp. D173a TaxID=2836349 RepID=UPI0025567E20
MIQNITNKKTILAVVCAAALAGCLDDPYQEPSTTPPPIKGDVLPLYGPDANSDFQLTIVDMSGVEALVEESGITIQGNISATHVSGQNSGTVNIAINNS